MAFNASTACTTLIRGVELMAAPWKNGGGVTREVAAFPAGAGLDAFVWRVSIANVAQAGPFSRFTGIDRTLVLLSGAGMLLDETGASNEAVTTHALTQPLDIARFNGEAQIDARLVDGATRDFNLMVRRAAASGEVDVWRGATQRTLSADVVLLFCATGSAEVQLSGAQLFSLDVGDTLRIDAPRDLLCIANVKGQGAMLVITLRYAPR